MRFRFPSQIHPDQFCYEVMPSYRDLQAVCGLRPYLAEWAAKYETLGDGLTQHAPEFPAFPDDLGDFCGSLLTYYFGAPDQLFPLLETIERQWPKPIGRDSIVAACKVRFRPDKLAYYCVNGFRVSASASKRHDQRWKEVPPWADGSPTAVFGLLNRDLRTFGTLEALARYREILAVFKDVTGIDHGTACKAHFSPDPAVYLAKTAHGADAAFDGLALLIESARSRIYAHRHLDNWIHNRIHAGDILPGMLATAPVPSES